jgi:ribose transport system ATP-binding protein
MASLEIQNASKSFPGVRALDGVSLQLEAGEIHALMGENGAGKSTLIKIITGLYRPDEGHILLNGSEAHFNSSHDSIAAGIGVVHQERNLIPRFTVGENIVLERMPSRMGLVNFNKVNEEAATWLSALELNFGPETPVSALSVAQLQLVEIAKTLSLQSKILLLDEPTASITPRETARLFKILRDLRDKGVAIMFVSHKLEEVFELCDRVTVLRDGRNTMTGEDLSGTTHDELVASMVGRAQTIEELPPKKTENESALELRHLQTSLGHRDVSFSLRKGEILGLYGLIGAGRSELARAIIGDEKIIGGEILVKGEIAHIRSVGEALDRYRIGYVSENRKEEGLILPHSVRANIAISIWDRLRKAFGWIGRGAERTAVTPLVEQLDIRTPSLEHSVTNLSGGNQQKVSLAKWLAARTEVLIVDEPTVGIDVKTKRYFHELIWQLASDGIAIVLISSDMPEMILLADRILVMNEMEIIEELKNTHNYEEVSEAIMGSIQATQ